MEIPMGDDNFFHPADLNICIFPHLNEFLVVDARATVPGRATCLSARHERRAR